MGDLNKKNKRKKLLYRELKQFRAITVKIAHYWCGKGETDSSMKRTEIGTNPIQKLIQPMTQPMTFQVNEGKKELILLQGNCPN